MKSRRMHGVAAEDFGMKSRGLRGAAAVAVVAVLALTAAAAGADEFIAQERAYFGGTIAFGYTESDKGDDMLFGEKKTCRRLLRRPLLRRRVRGARPRRRRALL